MKQVFISYKHDDGDFAENVKGRLEKAGFAVWIDDSLPAGEEWRLAIDRAIRESVAVIVIMTPDARGSEYVTYEWAFALGEGKPVIPVMLRKTELHPRLEALQYLDFSQRRGRPWDTLIERVRTVSAGRELPSPVQQQLNTLLNTKAYNAAARLEAARALRDLGDSAAVPGLGRALASDLSVRVRICAAETLGWLGDLAAEAHLKRALKDEHPKVRDAAAAALKRLGVG